ncbi:serine/threonine-protein kinase [Actinomadura scrupuli]|uniref:serine/threonine-protein kinase n=1 Tax=Actinomadura scrupuli TaxID=559629 RepID=UPI003D958139
MRERSAQSDRVIARRYRLGTRLGHGGMGAVWLAHDETLGRDVAVKEVLSPPGLSADEQSILYQRAMREARSAARLSHPGVVTIYDVVEEEGRPWVVMELLHARSLQEIIETEGPLPPHRVAGIARQVMAALSAAHSVGILHRDVKPGNVLLLDGDKAVLTDFGIAVIIGEATLTQFGAVVGSPSYIAPERLHGARATPAADLWALGVLMYTAVDGRSPFQREDPVATFGAVLTEDVVVPPGAGPLKPVIEGLLRKEPERRLTAPAVDPFLGRAAASTDSSPRSAAAGAETEKPGLREPYDLGLQGTLMAVGGLLVFLAPELWADETAQARLPFGVLGPLMALAGLYSVLGVRGLGAWGRTALGVLVNVSPWAFGFTGHSAAAWTAWAAGGLVVLAGLWEATRRG